MGLKSRWGTELAVHYRGCEATRYTYRTPLSRAPFRYPYAPPPPRSWAAQWGQHALHGEGVTPHQDAHPVRAQTASRVSRSRSRHEHMLTNHTAEAPNIGTMDSRR